MLGNAQMLTIGNLLFLAGIMVRSYPNENSCSGDFDATTLMSEFDSILAGFLRGFLYTCVFVQLTFTTRTSLYSIHLLMFRKMLMGPKSTSRGNSGDAVFPHPISTEISQGGPGASGTLQVVVCYCVFYLLCVV